MSARPNRISSRNAAMRAGSHRALKNPVSKTATHRRAASKRDTFIVGFPTESSLRIDIYISYALRCTNAHIRARDDRAHCACASAPFPPAGRYSTCDPRAGGSGGLASLNFAGKRSAPKVRSRIFELQSEVAAKLSDEAALTIEQHMRELRALRDLVQGVRR